MNAAKCTECNREIAEVKKKKWQDIQPVAKGREAERLKTVRGTGGGLAPVDETEPWDRVVSILSIAMLHKTHDKDSANVFMHFTPG